MTGLETAAATEAAVATVTASAAIVTSTATAAATPVETAAAAATTTATAFETAAAATAAAARTACFAGTSFVHRQRAPFNCLTMKAADRFLGCRVRRHGHECETTRLVRELVENNLHFRDITDLAEQILQFAFCHRES